MTVDEDYVVCGSCEETFPLDRMTLFLQHKRFDCDEKPNTGESRKQLWCGSCLEKFETPWSLLKHAQTVHALRIFLQNNARPLSQISDTNVGTLEAQEAKISALQANLIALQEEVSNVVLKQTEKQHVPLKENVPTTKQPTQQWPKPHTSTDTRRTQSLASTLKSPTSVNAPICDNTTLTASTEEKTGIPAAVVASHVKSLNQNATTPVHVNVGTKQMSVLVSKPQSVKTIPALSKLTQGTYATLHNKPRVFKTIKKAAPKSILAPKTQGGPVVSQTVIQVQVPPSNASMQSSAQLGPEVSSTISMIQQPTQNVNNKEANVNNKEAVAFSHGKKLMTAKIVSSDSALLQTDCVSAPVTAGRDSIQNVPGNAADTQYLGMKVEPTVTLLPLDPSATLKARVTSPVQTVSSTTQAGKYDNDEVQLGVPVSSRNVFSSPATMASETDTSTPREANAAEEKKTGKEEENELCCDNQDCGVTVMPGTHEKLQECCSAVLPKKRKRHMEMKHWGYIKSARKRFAPKPVKKASESTIYIDFEHIDAPRTPQSNKNEHHPSGILFDNSDKAPTPGSAGVAIGIDNVETSGGTRKVKQGSASSERSVIIPAGTTFSIPLSYAVSAPSTSGTLGKSRIPSTAVRFHTGVTGGASPIIKAIKQEIVSHDQPADHPQEENKYSDLADIRQKRRRYPTSRPFKCDECEHSFNQRIHLKKHKSKHTGIKPFKCEQCDYSTVERSHLKVHIRVHTGEKPFKCTYCEYATAQNSTLKIHLKRHHSTSRSSTRASSTVTSSTAAASVVTAASDQEDSLQCCVCQQRFPTKDVFDEHKKHHKTDSE